MAESQQKNRSVCDLSQKSTPKSEIHPESPEMGRISQEEHLNPCKEEQKLSQQMSSLSVTNSSQKSPDDRDNDLEFEIMGILGEKTQISRRNYTSIPGWIKKPSTELENDFQPPDIEEIRAEDDSGSDDDEQNLSQHMSSLTVSKTNEESLGDLNNDLELNILEILEEKQSLDLADIEDLTSILPDVTHHSKICRICGKPGENLNPIFTEETEMEGSVKEISLLEKIHFYTPISVKKDDNLPQNICDLCKKHLDKSCEIGFVALNTEANLMNSLEIKIDEKNLLDIIGRNSTENQENPGDIEKSFNKKDENSGKSEENSAIVYLSTEEQNILNALEELGSSLDEETFWKNLPKNSVKNGRNNELPSENCETHGLDLEYEKLYPLEKENDEGSLETCTTNCGISEIPKTPPKDAEIQLEDRGVDMMDPKQGNSAENDEIVSNSQESCSSSSSSGSYKSFQSCKTLQSIKSTTKSSEEPQKNYQGEMTDDAMSSFMSSDQDTMKVEKLGSGCGRKRLFPESLDPEETNTCSKFRKIEPKFEKWYKCNKCPASFQDDSAAESHKKRHYLKMPVSQWCAYCSREFSKESRLANHIFREHAEEYRQLTDAFKCPICHRLFSLRNNALVHLLVDCTLNSFKDFTANDIKEVSVKFSYTCEYCFKGFAYVTSLNEHRNKYHSAKKLLRNVFTCIIDKEEKKERLFELGTIKLAFVCKFCSKIFVSLTTYCDHLTEHIDGKFCCLMCKRKFDSYDEVRKHKDSHPFRIILRQVLTEAKEMQYDDEVGLKKIRENFFLFESPRIPTQRLVISNSF